MIVIACVDERNGLMFNHRRQSRDSVVCRDILRECGGKKLYMSSYSGKLFEGIREDGEGEKNRENRRIREDRESREDSKVPEGTESAEIRISENIMHQAGMDDACFIEETDITGFEEQIDKVVLYKWNRKYPADRYFSLNLSDGFWELLRSEELQGSSHERITKEIYEKRVVKEV